MPFFLLNTYARNEQGLSYESLLNPVLFERYWIYRAPPAQYSRLLSRDAEYHHLMVILSSLSTYTWAAVSSTINIYAWIAFYSLFFRGVQSPLPGALTSLSSDPQKQGTRMGMIFSVMSFGCLIGALIAVALISGSERGCSSAQILAETCLEQKVCFSALQEN